MTGRIIRTLLLSLALVFITAPMAFAAHEGPIAKIIKHAKELKLTSEQISKLEALEKEIHGTKEPHKEVKAKVKAILTPEQIEKIKKYIEEHKKA